MKSMGCHLSLLKQKHKEGRSAFQCLRCFFARERVGGHLYLAAMFEFLFSTVVSDTFNRNENDIN
jgi:hypothetical protein